MEVSGWDAAGVIVKAIVYVTTLGAAGGVLFLSYARPLTTPVDQRIRTLIAILCIAGCATSVIRILVLSASMTGDLTDAFDPASAQMSLRAGEGRATGIRLAGLGVVLATLRGPGRSFAASLAGALFAATSFAWIGHVHALRSAAPCLVLGVHLLSAAFWFGALMPLLITARTAPSDDAAIIVARFGKIAVAVAALLAGAGIVVLCTLLGSAAALWTSAYGRLITVKLMLVGAMLGLAVYNKLRLTPRLARTATAPSALRQLRRSIKIELALGCCVLLATAAFTSLTGPPR